MLILGKPGGGKGTISGKILQVRANVDHSFASCRVSAYQPCFLFCLQDFPQLHHLSTGDLLRQNVRMKTELGNEAKAYMDSGRLVPDELMIDLVMSDATPHLEDGKSILLDGFPRTLPQAQALDQVVNIDAVVNLDIPTDVIVNRIADR
jgi:adenylate kinase family enzyme